MQKIYLNGKNNDKFVMVDDCDYKWLKDYNWFLNGYDTVWRNRLLSDENREETQLLIYREIWQKHNGNIPKGLIVEHIDRNRLNCQLANLRLATLAENNCNRSKQKNNTSGMIDVGYTRITDKRKKSGWYQDKWRAKVKKDGKTYSKKFPYTDVDLLLAGRWADIKKQSLHQAYTGELNFESHEDFRKRIIEAIYKECNTSTAWENNKEGDI
jgi:hypothetical protein